MRPKRHPLAGDLDVPVLTPTHQRALALLPRGHPAAIAGLVRTDPSLAGAVLRAANSAQSAPRERIRSIERAVIRIGTMETRRLVGATVLRTRFGSLSVAGLDEDELWRHLAVCAVVTESAGSGQERSAQRAIAYSAGLLHDVGRLAMAHADPERYGRVVLAVSEGASAEDAERAEFGTTHESLAPRVLRSWGVETEVVAAAADHHAGKASDFAAAVRMARDVAQAIGVGDGLPKQEDASSGGLMGDEVTAALGRAGGTDTLLARASWIDESSAGDEGRAHRRRIA